MICVSNNIKIMNNLLNFIVNIITIIILIYTLILGLIRYIGYMLWYGLILIFKKFNSNKQFNMYKWTDNLLSFTEKFWKL
jgi:hypothetical protein